MATTARLRQAFKYPAADPTAPALDEQEQAELITQLRAHDATTTALYRHLFAAIPLLAGLLTVYHQLTSPTNLGLPTTLLVLSSLGATSYTLYAIPLPRAQTERAYGERYGSADGLSPLQRYLVPLNALLACFLTIGGAAAIQHGQARAWEDGEVFAVLPFCKFCVFRWLEI
jgi:hypothetical protein